MAVMDFSDLCASICKLADLEPPVLVPDENGLVAFTLERDDVDVGFIEDLSQAEAGALMVVEFGVPPDAEDTEGELHMLRDLLDTNFLISGVGAPAFVRNPFTGAIALHQSCLLSQVRVEEVYQLALRAADAALRWRQGSFRDLGGVHAMSADRVASVALFG